MKWLLVFLFLLVSCSNDTGVAWRDSLSSEPVAGDSVEKPSAKPVVDTVYQVVVDTQYVYQTDTSFVYNTDTVYVVQRDIMPVSDDIVTPSEGADTLNIVYFGNSLTKGFDSFGMTASAATHDYCARVNQHYAEQGYVVKGTRVTSSTFEKLLDKSKKDLIVSVNLYPFLSSHTDIVVIQLGDNVSDEKQLAAFKESFAELLDSVRSRIPASAKIICVSSWYSSQNNERVPKPHTPETVDKAREAIKNMAAEKGAAFADISDLYANESNRSFLGAVIYRPEVKSYSMTYESISEVACTLTITFTVDGKSITTTILPDGYTIDTENKVVSWSGHELIVSNSDMASHPGDQGFIRIANKIIRAIGNLER